MVAVVNPLVLEGVVGNVASTVEADEVRGLFPRDGDRDVDAEDVGTQLSPGDEDDAGEDERPEVAQPFGDHGDP